MPDTDPDEDTSAKAADDLAHMAVTATDPGTRALLLQWAQAFRRLAALHESETPPRQDG